MNTKHNFNLRTLAMRQYVAVRYCRFVQDEHAGAALALLNLLQDLRQATGAWPTDYAGIKDCAKRAVLVRWSDNFALHGHASVGIVELPVYFREVRQHQPMSPEALAQRVAFAEATGFLLMQPDETIAVTRSSRDGQHMLVDAVRCQSSGIPVFFAGVHDSNLAYKSEQRSIARDLDVEDARRALAESMGDLLWWSNPDNLSCPEHVRRLRQTVDLLEKHIPTARPKRTATGAIITSRDGASKGAFDAATARECGWMHYDTWQDAWYFEVRINPRTLEVMTFAEGDISHVKCETADQFLPELAELARFYGKQRSACAVAHGPGVTTQFFDTLFLEPGDGGEYRVMKRPCIHVALNGNAGLETQQAPLFAALLVDGPAWRSLAQGPDDVPVTLTSADIRLDQLNPLAFESFACKATKRGDCIELVVDFGDRGARVLNLAGDKLEGFMIEVCQTPVQTLHAEVIDV